MKSTNLQFCVSRFVDHFHQDSVAKIDFRNNRHQKETIIMKGIKGILFQIKIFPIWVEIVLRLDTKFVPGTTIANIGFSKKTFSVPSRITF